MPFYDYRCLTCGATVEVLHGIDDQEPRTHEGCGGSLERQFSAASIHFKGSGWAKLDRRSGSSASSEAPSSAPTPAPKADAT
ncbi:MAG: FmdB family transcriptional regulator [bacterium]|jgi:putative FmdB family regulatory protein|nr:FmdB family transcriptional regulator [Chloroflexota bacterium]NBO52514.1 FmdB family transcriptional regulator [Candidatus Aquidulcis sp.]